MDRQTCGRMASDLVGPEKRKRRQSPRKVLQKFHRNSMTRPRATARLRIHGAGVSSFQVEALKGLCLAPSRPAGSGLESSEPDPRSAGLGSLRTYTGAAFFVVHDGGGAQFAPAWYVDGFSSSMTVLALNLLPPGIWTLARSSSVMTVVARIYLRQVHEGSSFVVHYSAGAQFTSRRFLDAAKAMTRPALQVLQ